MHMKILPKFLISCVALVAVVVVVTLSHEPEEMEIKSDSIVESHYSSLYIGLQAISDNDNNPISINDDNPEMDAYLHDGCAALEDSFCQRFINPKSYCKSYQTDECGRAVCQGESFLLPCGASDTLPTPSPPPLQPPTLPPTLPPYTLPPSTGEPDPEKLYLDYGCTVSNLCAIWGSYCKDWQLDDCGRAVCHGRSHDFLTPCSSIVGSPPTTRQPTPSSTPSPAVTNIDPSAQSLFAYIEDPINTQVFDAKYDEDAIRSLSYFVVGITPNSYSSARRTFAMLLSLQLSGWNGKILLQPDLTTDAVCNTGGAGCGDGDYHCAVNTCFATIRSVLGESFSESVDGVLLENENNASPALKKCSAGGDRKQCLDAFRTQPGAGDWELWTIPSFTSYGSSSYAEMNRFSQFYNMYSRGSGGTYPCVKCGPSPGCELDFEAWRAQPSRGCLALAPQFGGAICFRDASRTVECAGACGGEPCLTKMDAGPSTAFGGGIYDPVLANITPEAVGRYLGGIYVSGGVHRLPHVSGATAVVTIPFTTASQPSFVGKLRRPADVEALAKGMQGAFEAAEEDFGTGTQPLRMAAWGAPCWLINSNARYLVEGCAGA